MARIIANEERLQALLIGALKLAQVASPEDDSRLDAEIDDETLTLANMITGVDDPGAFLTRDAGVDLRFSDGSRWLISISPPYERPDTHEGECSYCGADLETDAVDGDYEYCAVCAAKEY